MALKIEQYAMIGDLQTAALVGSDGAVDWLCLPRFDSDAVFAALVGTGEHGRWTLNPASRVTETTRRYRGDTLVLETTQTCDEGTVRLIDFMPRAERDAHHLVRIVEGVAGSVPMETTFAPRFGYGHHRPFAQTGHHVASFVAGPDALRLEASVALEPARGAARAHFVVRAGERESFVLTWHPSHARHHATISADAALRETDAYWRRWSRACTYQGPYRDAVLRSLMTLKALSHEATGGMVAAATTSLPEEIGGIRNWDYRYCWLRDATLTLEALLIGGYVEEAEAWRDWLVRTVAGEPEHLQIMYGLGGEQRLVEQELDWLPGYEGSRPVRIGNGAYDQKQLDVYGELVSCLYRARAAGMDALPDAWPPTIEILAKLETAWREPDQGLWETRGGERHFTHSKLMAWVAMDRACRFVLRFGFGGEAGRALHLPRWQRLRDEIHRDICARAFHPSVNAFTQSYDTDAIDASVLLMPHLGFLPPDDPRVLGTVAAVERELLVDGFVRRYATEKNLDGLAGDESPFLACSFWLADNYAMTGRLDEAKALLDRLVGLCNDVGLLAEEYDPRAGRQIGNFPQAFSHVALVISAFIYERAAAGQSVASLMVA